LSRNPSHSIQKGWNLLCVYEPKRSYSGTQEGFIMGKNVYVGNLPHSVGEAELKELFEQKGNVESVTIIRDNDTGRSRGFAFVDMSTEEDARKAIEGLNAFSLEGRNLTVNEARPKPDRRRGFAGGRGGRRDHSNRGRGGFHGRG
jgi:cold-inducible RNA-binding protein